MQSSKFRKLLIGRLTIWLILLIILILPIFTALIRPGFFFMQDDLQAFRIHQMSKCFQDFQIPCRWVPDGGFGYGYPQFLYYPPSVYYLGAIIHLFGIQIIDAVKILFILGYVLSAFFMFIFLRSFFDGESKEKSFETTTLPAFLGALLYTYVPYKALEVYVRGALSELWSMVFFPLVFLSIYLVITKKNLKYVVLLSLSIGGLLITHNLMTLIFAPVALIWCLTLIFLKKEWKSLPKIFIGGILGLGLAAFYTLPVVFESKYAHLETLLGGYFDWRQHFVNLERLFFSNHWGYGSSGLGQDNDLTLSTGQIHWMIGLLALILGIISFQKSKGLAIITNVLVFVEILVLFLIHQRSTLIWERITILSWLQFPWRFLTNSIFILSLLGGVTIYFIGMHNKLLAKIFAVVIFIGIFILHGQFFQSKEWVNITDNEKFSGQSWQKQLTISIFDYLPIYAKLPPNHEAPKQPEVLEGRVNFLNYQKGSNYQFGEVDVKETAVLRLPLFDFPGMEVSVDGKKVTHINNDCRGEEYCFGLITFNIDKGVHTIKAQLKDTPIRTAGNVTTLASFIILGFLVFKKATKKEVRGGKRDRPTPE